MLNLFGSFGSVYRLKSSLRIESWKIGFGSSQKIPGSAKLVLKSQFWNLAEWALICCGSNYTKLYMNYLILAVIPVYAVIVDIVLTQFLSVL